MCTGSHPYIPAHWVMEARLLFHTNGGVAENVLNFQLDHAPTNTDLATLASDLHGWYTALYKQCISAGVNLYQITCTDLTTDTGPQILYTTGLPEAGTLSGDGLPDNVTLAVKHVTINRGRSYRGRTYIPGLANTALASADVVNSTYIGFVTDAFQGLLDAPFTTNNEAFSIVSRCQDKNWLVNAVVTPVSGSAVDNNIDSMRRRLKGRGI